MRLLHLFEALQPSEYRPLVKGWDKTKYAELFNNQYRLYFPLASSPSSKTKVNPQIQQAVQSAGYNIDDYVAGIASKTNDPTRKIKIGKLIKDPVLLQTFANDPSRAATKEEQLVVISRHPYDIAGMSTDRGWTSCTNLKDGMNRRFVPLEIKAGTVVAYLINTNDKDIKSPIARMLIKPFVNSADNSIAFGIENVMYGTGNASFKTTVTKWVNAVNKSRELDGIYRLSPTVYQDTENSTNRFFGPNKAMWRDLAEYPALYMKNHPEASDDMKLAAVRQDGYAIQFTENPSEAVQLGAVRQNGQAIQFIENPSEEVQIAAVKQDGYTLKLIKNPSEAVQLGAVRQNGQAIQFIENPTDEMKLAAVNKNGYTIRYIRNPTEEMKLIAVSRYGRAISEIENPTEEMKLAAVTNDGIAIRHIKNPSDEVKLAAVSLNGLALEYIQNPSEEVQLTAVRKTGIAIQFIGNPSEEVQLAAVSRDGYAIYYIKNPSEEVQIAAVSRDRHAIQYLKNPSEAVQALANQK